MSVGDDEPLSEDDGLVDDELVGDFVGLTDLLGFGLPLGLGTVTGGCADRLGVGVSVLGGGRLVGCDGVVAGELRCCAVLSTFPLFRLEMCPVR